MSERRFQLKLFCCDLEPDIWPLQGPGLTWEHADEVRNSYITSPGGHVRYAFIEYYAPNASDG